MHIPRCFFLGIRADKGSCFPRRMTTLSLTLFSICLVFFPCCQPPEKAVEQARPFTLEKSPQIFEPVRTFEPGLGDLDGDGDPDLLAGNDSLLPAPDRLYLNDGTGYFTRHTGSVANAGHQLAGRTADETIERHPLTNKQYAIINKGGE